MVYLDRAPTMDPSLSSSLNKLSDDIAEAKIIEVIIKYRGLKKMKGIRRWEQSSASKIKTRPIVETTI
jgi:predicted mannosyl-3-phosphoglycerate phosphatase (HAD superfamily)